MRATVGDRIVRASGHVDGAVRDGLITEVRGADGAPPYTVRWSDTGDESLVFPGGDCLVEPGGEAAHPAVAHPRSRTWQVTVTMVESGPSTTAEATLVSGDIGSLRAVGRAQKDPSDAEVAVVGDEIAAGRALRRLADALLGQAERDITASTGIRGHVHA
ncbi:dsRBD fold-containing protein [Xylanimonas sp. McL0601]|uniref:dsRBD fold-containing protein n=1 Tax=Xylanimonas sp. McL0601 TaxID=3414739 RepID=UPI003CE6DCBB